ncbi:MAG TPA: hypothetical protein VKA06_09795 [Spirochaetia bacterium]|nr:hypothetical protein [Spirochaetia bacterium]
MTIIVVTSSRSVKKAFASAGRSRTYSVEFMSPDRIKDALAHADSLPESFLYLDADGTDVRTLKRRIKSLRDARPYRYGIIDPGGNVADVAELFHHAAADYVSKPLLGAGVSTARLRRVVEFEPVPVVRNANDHVPEHENHQIFPSGTDWTSVRDGEEYTFLMLYAGIDEAGDLRRKSSEAFLGSLRKSFSSMLENAFADFNARVWMWKEDEGLLLMPFDGRQIDAMIPALRQVLNRAPINVDEFSQYGELSWRLALHLGNTTYRSGGRTGSIVSESLNFLFHLGSQFVDPGGLAVTAPCYALIPEPVRPLLNHRGEFESVHVYALRDLV